MTTPPTLRGIDHVVLRVADIDRSVEWYRSHLGVAVERYAEWQAGDSPFVSLRVSPTSLIDLLPGAPDGVNVDHVALVTDRESFDRFAADHADLVEMGPARLFGAQGVGDGLYVRDPDDHRVELRTYG